MIKFLNSYFSNQGYRRMENIFEREREIAVWRLLSNIESARCKQSVIKIFLRERESVCVSKVPHPHYLKHYKGD